MLFTLVDYGVGNLHSLRKAIARNGVDVTVETDVGRALDADCIVLPGVGAFGEAMQTLEAQKKDLVAALEGGMPALGICLGMQVLFERSEESSAEGLGFIRGTVRRFVSDTLRIPEMGWNAVDCADDPVFRNVPPPSHFYFANSYYGDPGEDVAIAYTDYGIRFVSAIKKRNTYAFQFHPEKSSDIGLRVVANLVECVKQAVRT